MKNREFIERVKGLGFRLVEDGVGVAVYDKEMTCELADVSDMHEKRFVLDLDVVDLTESEQEALAKLVVEYGMTPLEKRKDEKRWRVRLGNNAFCHYLNYRKSDREYTLSDGDDTEVYRTKFTWQEIADYLKTDDKAFVDSFIKRFGEEVTE